MHSYCIIYTHIYTGRDCILYVRYNVGNRRILYRYIYNNYRRTSPKSGTLVHTRMSKIRLRVSRAYSVQSRSRCPPDDDTLFFFFSSLLSRPILLLLLLFWRPATLYTHTRARAAITNTLSLVKYYRKMDFPLTLMHDLRK